MEMDLDAPSYSTRETSGAYIAAISVIKNKQLRFLARASTESYKRTANFLLVRPAEHGRI